MRTGGACWRRSAAGRRNGNDLPATGGAVPRQPGTLFPARAEGAEGSRANLAYSALFLAEDAGILWDTREKGTGGGGASPVRDSALGDPVGDRKGGRTRRGKKGIGKCHGRQDPPKRASRCTGHFFYPTGGNTSSGLHGTVRYNSVYIAEDELIGSKHRPMASPGAPGASGSCYGNRLDGEMAGFC